MIFQYVETARLILASRNQTARNRFGTKAVTESSQDSGHFILHAMVSIAAADHELDHSETETIRQIYAKITHGEIGEDDVRQAVEQRRSSETTLARELARADLDKASRENIIRASYLVLLADGRIAARERKTLHDLAHAMKIPEIHFTAILEDLSNWS